MSRMWAHLARAVLAACWLAGLVEIAAAAGDRRSQRTEIVRPDAAPLVLYSEEAGQGSPVVLIHGFGESIFTWRKIMPALAQRHRVIALDLKGFGRSDKPLDMAYSADDQAAIVARFLEVRRLSGASLVGHSFGGTVALRTALVPEVKAKGRVARLAVISAPALPSSVASDLNLAALPGLPEAVTLPLPPKTMARLLLSEARGGGDVSDEDIEGYAAPYYELPAKHAFVVTARSILSEDGGEIAERYKGIRQRTLVVWCRGDTIVPLRSGRRLARALPNARLVVLERCHHLPQDERPGALLSVLAPFLDR